MVWQPCCRLTLPTTGTSGDLVFDELVLKPIDGHLGKTIRSLMFVSKSYCKAFEMCLECSQYVPLNANITKLFCRIHSMVLCCQWWPYWFDHWWRHKKRRGKFCCLITVVSSQHISFVNFQWKMSEFSSVLLRWSLQYGRCFLSPLQRLLLIRTRRGRVGNRKVRGEQREEGRKREKPLPDNVRFIHHTRKSK